eukprot:1790123-Prymnesium_polylepis.1
MPSSPAGYGKRYGGRNVCSREQMFLVRTDVSREQMFLVGATIGRHDGPVPRLRTPPLPAQPYTDAGGGGRGAAGGRGVAAVSARAR